MFQSILLELSGLGPYPFCESLIKKQDTNLLLMFFGFMSHAIVTSMQLYNYMHGCFFFLKALYLKELYV